MSINELETFIKSKMSKSHIYQPAVIKTLLENGGEATVESIALQCNKIQGQSIDSYQKSLQKYPKAALIAHGVIRVDGKLFTLTANLADCGEEKRRELISLCEEALKHHIPKL